MEVRTLRPRPTPNSATIAVVLNYYRTWIAGSGPRRKYLLSKNEYLALPHEQDALDRPRRGATDGMSTRDIQGHLQEMYGVEVSPDLVSRVTDAVAEDVAAWQQWPLDAVYCIVYPDALVVKVRDQGVVKNKAVYLALGVTTHGSKEVLGLWVEQSEGAKFWLKIINELKTRGVRDILIACCDGLEAVFPKPSRPSSRTPSCRRALRI